MLPLAWFLAAFLLVSLLCLTVGGVATFSSGADARERFKLSVALYPVIIFLLLGWMLHYFIGWNGRGSTSIPKEFQRRFAHVGYYFKRDGELRLVGKPNSLSVTTDASSNLLEPASRESDIIRQLMPIEALGPKSDSAAEPGMEAAPEGTNLESGFVQAGLEAGEYLHLRPVWNKDRAAEWSLTYKINDRPLRVRTSEGSQTVSRCVNLPDERWLSPGDTLFFTIERNGVTEFISVKWDSGSKYVWPFTRPTNAYSFGQGFIRSGVLDYQKGPNLLMSERVLIDGITVSDLLRQAKKEFRDQVGTLDQQWWDFLSHVMLVRERRGDSTSPVGVLLENELFLHPGLNIYKNYGPSSLSFTPHDGEASLRVPTSATVVYGLQDTQNSFELHLADEVVKDDIWGQIVHVNFTHPKAWSLPPSPKSNFIITSSSDYIPLDGYLLDIGDSPHSFYAKAKLSDSLDELLINDGRNIAADAPVNETASLSSTAGDYRRFALGQPASLGDYEQGVLVSLVSTQSGGPWSELPTAILGAPYVGVTATILIALSCAAFILLVRKRWDNRPKLFLAWAIVWGTAMTLLTVRLVLAYRVSLVPPLDASLREVRNVFNKGVDYSLIGLALTALLTAILFLAPLKTRRTGWAKKHLKLLLTLWGTIIILYSIAGGIFGTNQSFFGIRISIADHAIIAIGLALIGGAALEHVKSRYRYLMALIILAALALQIVVVKDAGSIIYALSFIWCVGAIVGWRRPNPTLGARLTNFMIRWPRLWRAQRRLSRVLPTRLKPAFRAFGRWLKPISIPFSLFIALLIVPYLIQTGWMRKVVQPALPDTTFYRFASFTDSEDVILTTKSGEEDADMTKLLDNSRQDWQMLLYASHGASAPKGYGQAPLSKVGMTYSTSVSDCAFSTYMLAEHGRAAALLLLSIYVLLAIVCALAGWYFDDNARHRSVTLLFIGSFLACNALYMASANIGLLTFTGQNMPMLGLNSGGDLAQGLLLCWLLGWLLVGSAQEGSPDQLRLKHAPVFRTGVVLCIVALLWLIAVGVRMKNVGLDERYRADHDFKPETFKTIENNLPTDSTARSPRRNGALALVGDKLAPAAGGQITEIEEQYVKQFNARTDKFNPNGGLYYLERGREQTDVPRVRVNRRFFYARSPFSERAFWNGQIVAGGERDSVVYALNKRKEISLKSSGYPGSVDLADMRPIRTTSSVRFYERATQFFELRRDGDRVRLDPYTGNWRIYVDGRRVTSGLDLEPLSIIVIEQSDDRYRRNLIYLGPTRPVLAYVRWRNGERRRMFPEGSLALAHFLGKAADKAAAAEASQTPANKRLGDELTLNLDVSLNRSLQQTLVRYARSNPNYDPLRPRPNRLAVTVLDAFSGQVLALPSWPMLDPGKPEYETLIDKIPEPTRSRYEENHNLTPHVVGSTIKPLTFAAMAAALWPERDLGRAIVYNRTEVPSASGHPHTRVAGIRLNEPWDCNSTRPEFDMRDFIVNSRDFPQGLLGMLGMVVSEREFGRVLVRDEVAPDISFGGSRFKIDLTRASESGTAFSLLDQRDRGRASSTRGPEIVRGTVLFRWLNSIFDFDYSGTPTERLGRACSRFLPSLANEKLSLEENEYLNNVVPARLDMGLGDFQDIRGGLISCLLGGGECGFNNVSMAEAGARLAIGERVFARLENGTPAAATQLPPPLNNARWRELNLTTPMQEVGEEGTAEALQASVRIPPQYKAIYKTGTLLEGNDDRESEALMFVVGRWADGTGFVRGETLAGFLYMERSKVKDRSLPDGNMKKFRFAAPILNRLIEHLVSTRDAAIRRL